MSVRVVTDSTAHLRPEVVRELGITVVPFHLQIGDRSYLDGLDIDEGEFYRLVYELGLEVETFEPNVEEFYQVYGKLNESTGEVLSLHLSAALSSAAQNAQEAADMLLGRCQIAVVDSQSVSVGLGSLVEAAARAAANGETLDEIVRLVRGLINQIYVVFFSEGLDYLERGGRIGEAQALLGTMLGIKPFLTLEGGDILPIEKVRTREEAIEKLIEFISEFDAIRELTIVKGLQCPADELRTLLERLELLFPALDVPVINYGPVLAAHIGPSTLGAIIYEEADYEG
jgi:DegV family protein with EDD domain